MVAGAALFLWPFICLIFFRVWKLPTAVSASLLGGYLLLPTQTKLDLPVLPALDKNSIPALTTLCLTIWALGRDRAEAAVSPGWLPRDRMSLLLLSLFVVSAIGTALTNSEGVMNGSVYQPGLRLYDGLSIGLTMLIALLPLLLGRKILATAENQRQFLTVLVLAAVGYAFLALYEVRMSPQLNKMVYGFFPHSWLQHIRGGGFRPLVFLTHGLWLGIFFACAALAAVGMALAARTGADRLKFTLAAFFLIVTIFMSKVLGALALTLLLTPILFLPKRVQVIATAGLAAIVLLYPTLRAVDLVPTERVLSIASSISVERASSLKFRLDQEDRLLEHAQRKPMFGWGGYNRDRIFNDEGRDTTVTDGRWIIVFSQGGWARYFAEFGLFVWGATSLLWRRDLQRPTVIITVMLVVNLLDLLPNSGLSPLTYMMAGALIGSRERIRDRDSAGPEPDPVDRKAPVLRRDFSRPDRSLPDTGRPAVGYRRNLQSGNNNARH